MERELSARIFFSYGRNSLPKNRAIKPSYYKVTQHYVIPGPSAANSYIESFHGKFRGKCLSEL